MPINHIMGYKPNVMLDQPIAVQLPAADWLLFMALIARCETPGLDHIIETMSDQVAHTIYSTAAIKAAAAHAEEHAAHYQPDLTHVMGHIDLTDIMANIIHALPPGTVYTIKCMVCNGEFDYTELPNGPIYCGHDGIREITNVKLPHA